MKTAIIFCLGVAIGAWASSYAPANLEPLVVEEDIGDRVAYLMGVAEGVRVEALRHCPCDTKRYLGAPCPGKATQ